MKKAGPASQPLFLITHEFYPRRGGIATFTEEMAKASVHMGYDVEVWAQSAPKTPEKRWPFRMRRLPLKGTHDLSCLLRLGRQLIRERRRLRYATVYLPEPGPMIAMMILQGLKTFRPKHLVLTFHGSEIQRFHRNPIYRVLTRRLIRHASRISTLTFYTQRLLLERFPEAQGKVFLTPGALRSDFAIVHSGRKQANERIVILTVGRLHPRKGHMATLAALRSLAPQFRDQIEYWIVGGQSKYGYGEQLRDEAEKLDFPVRFFGEVSDEELDLMYDRADIFAMTSVEHGDSIEGFGLVYLEASAHGIPIVGHSVGGVAEAVVNDVTGILAPPDRPAQLAAAFERLIADPKLRAGMGDAGRAWARKHQWVKSAEALFR